MALNLQFTPLAPQPSRGCSIIWMTTQEPLFVMPLTESQKPPVLVIETTHSQQRSTVGQLVTGPSQVSWFFFRKGEI